MIQSYLDHASLWKFPISLTSYKVDFTERILGVLNNNVLG